MDLLYQPLEHPDSIRLLKIPTVMDDAGEALQNLSLIAVRRSEYDRPRFQAVSYMWGDDTDQKLITIDGFQVPIRSNLWAFLHQAWSSGLLVINHLWIDALCISQTDLAEKAAQVQRIDQTFTFAERVLAWLGPEDQHVISDDDDLCRDDHFSRACGAPFWTRTWVVQEILLPRDLVFCYGPHVFPEAQFSEMHRTHSRTVWSAQHAEVASFLCERLSGLRETIHGVVGIDREDKSGGHSGSLHMHDLLRLIIAFQGSECSVALDKVYALLRIVYWGGRAGLEVDYPIDEVLLYFRVLSSTSTGKVTLAEADALRWSLRIETSRFVDRSSELLREGLLSELEIEVGFSLSMYNAADGGLFPHRYGKSTVHRHLHSGVFEDQDLLAELYDTDVSLVLGRVGQTGRYVVKGMVVTVINNGLNHAMMHCPDACLGDFGDINWDLGDFPTVSGEVCFMPIKPKAWVSLCRHHWQKLEASASWNQQAR